MKGGEIKATAEPAGSDPALEILGGTASASYDVDRARVQAMAALQRYEGMIEEIDRRSVGTWIGIPPGMERWTFVRCGKRNAPQAQRIAAELAQFGFVAAPPSLRQAGFAHEAGGDGLYMAAPPEAAAARAAYKARLVRKRRDLVHGSIQRELGSIRGDVSVTGDEAQVTGADLVARWGGGAGPRR